MCQVPPTRRPAGLDERTFSHAYRFVKGELAAGNVSSFATFEQVMTKINKTEQEWRSELTPEQYRVLREKGTERAFTGEYDHVFEPGTYHCAGCGAELFESDTKYDSGCGWPAFYAPASGEAIDEETDASYGMVRTEVMCANCGGHLGHVFPDGPQDRGGLRYCINSASLRFVHRDRMEAEGYGAYLNQVEDIR
jgi:peptide-methionine (R)-S-oxide reductase